MTLWRLLRDYGVPTLLFVNKMDLPGADREAVLSELRRRLDEGCVDFSREEDEIWEEAALCDEGAMEAYLETGASPTRRSGTWWPGGGCSPATSAPPSGWRGWRRC